MTALEFRWKWGKRFNFTEQDANEFFVELDELLAAQHVQTLGEAAVLARQATTGAQAYEDIKKVQKAFKDHREAGPRLLAELKERVVIEAGVLVDLNNQPIHWHLPPGRNGGALPDSPDLWQVIWENRDRVLGFAHTHPWHGEPHPSGIDISTFCAVEAALGRHLKWWVVTFDQIGCWEFDGQSQAFEGGRGLEHPPWIDRLRELSRGAT